MRLIRFTAILALSNGVVIARPSHNRHPHAHPHLPRSASEDAIDTVFIYEFNGHTISAEEVKEGIANGTLVYANGAVVLAQSASAADADKTPAASLSVAPEMNAPAPAMFAIPTTSAAAPSPTGGASPQVPSASASSDDSSWAFAPSSAPVASDPVGLPEGLDTDFPDGKLDCSEFPTAYGAVALDYLERAGWSGIQCPGSQNTNGFADIETRNTGACEEGDFCSYACPAGFQKTQWPDTQGSTGQSVGGLMCSGGKLKLTNPNLSKKLCAQGNTRVPINAHNTMSEGAAICRTDYPGTEGQTIPLQLDAGSTSNLTCPDAAHYYNWQGKSTSAQYYVNPKGVSSEAGCQWGSPGGNIGNFAPLNLGVGYSNGAAWLSIFQNLPTTDAKLDFSIEVVGSDGGYDNLVGRCKYENGQFCSGENYSQRSSDGKGCTVSQILTIAHFVQGSLRDCRSPLPTAAPRLCSRRKQQ